jgi:integrase
MAYIAKDTRGGSVQWRLFFQNKHGRKQSIRLGPINKKAAEAVRVKVEPLIMASVTGTEIDSKAGQWVADLGDALRRKLVKAGLIAADATPDDQPQDAPALTLGAFLDAYFNAKTFAKPNTERNYQVTRRHLLGYFGADRPLADISAGCADEWREHLLGRDKLSGATVSREVKRARQFFRAAVRKRLIAENPFADLPTPQQVNKDREFFIGRPTTDKVLAACPDAEWRLIVALSRYGGLRCPSEHLALTLDDIDWERDRMTVRNPKTEHHPNGATRLVPLFPELRPYLAAVFDAAEPGTVYFINRYRGENVNLRTQFERIIKRAGLESWPRLFHNLRASRETELAAEHPIHVVCAWIGNSERIAAKHYLQVTDADFQRAAGWVGADSGCQERRNSGCRQWVPPSSARIRQRPPRNRKANGGQ